MVTPLLMGVLNVTPDSFSDGGRYGTLDKALSRAHEMLSEGADIIDVGGESTRPGADPVTVDEELRRVLPVIEGLAGHCRISVDTRTAEVARAAVAAGASIINDVSATLFGVAAETEAAWVAMHMIGDPRTMQRAPHYDDVVSEVRSFLVDRASVGRQAGVRELWIDPGFGFGKTVAHNVALLASIDELVATGVPVAIGTSRKSTLGALTAASDARVGLREPGTSSDPGDRLEASVATAVWAMHLGVSMVRTHDVRAHAHAVSVIADQITSKNSTGAK